MYERKIIIQAARVFNENQILKHYIKEQEYQIELLKKHIKTLTEELNELESNDFSDFSKDMFTNVVPDTNNEDIEVQKKCACIIV